MSKRNIVMMYVFHHQGCMLKDIAKDIDMKYSTIGTSVDIGVRNGEMESTGRNPKKYFCKTRPKLSVCEMNEYLLLIIKKYRHLTRSELQNISGVSVYTVEKTVIRLKSLGKISTMTGKGVTYKIPEKSKPPGRYITIDELRKLMGAPCGK